MNVLVNMMLKDEVAFNSLESLEEENSFNNSRIPALSIKTTPKMANMYIKKLSI
ncbi:hypothetical protein D3C71_2239220 [compost metagenome]